MAAVTNGHTNGINGHAEQPYARFSDIPAVIDIPVRGEDGDEAVNLDLTELMDETDELCDLLEGENAARNYWVTIALAYAKQKKVNIAIDILQKGLGAIARGRSEDKLVLLSCQCWLYLWKCRNAPRVKPTQVTDDDRTKDHWLHAATTTLNEASRISPQYPPLFLARGTLYLLRASLQPSKSGSGGADNSERMDTLKQAAKCFDDAYKSSKGKNVMAMLGKAKVQFSLGRYAESLAIYQQVLTLAPDLQDPDPRIGIGCCLWALGHKEHARAAWQRSLDINTERNIPANILLGLSYLDESSQYTTADPQFAEIYKKAMTTHTQTAFKLNGMHALACATFGSYFLLRKAWANVERLARRAIEQTDVNAVASDGWYLLARKEHYEGTDLAKAADYYSKADQARGGDEKGYLPAKFGAAQLKTLMADLDGAKFRLDKIISAPTQAVAGGQKSIEAMTLLGILHAEEVFANQAAGGKEDKSIEAKRAIGLLEQVRVAWKDPKRKVSPDSAVLLNLARLYEQEAPDRALGCLLQVEQMELDDIAEDDDRLPDDIGDEAEERRARRELLSPQLLNNIGCFHYQADKYTQAREDFQTALNSCVKMGERDDSLDTDALVTSISFNLARTYEAESMAQEANNIYSGLLERHPDYTDARARLLYTAILDPATQGEATENLKQLLQSEPGNLDLRALQTWHLHRTKKRTANLAEDLEQRHLKETLQKHDKHDLYSLIGMGNLHLTIAREMRRETDQDKEKRSKTYVRAIEFFDKVLSIDPRNAWAAQGMGIAMVEEKKGTQDAIQIFSKVRESLKGISASVYLNLGHVFAEMKQWSRSIENYELALGRSAKERGDGNVDPQILACLGRVWLQRGRQEKKLEAYKMSLDLSKQALELAPENINLRFNVAFVQIQLAQLLIGLGETQKTSEEVEDAAQGLDEAIEAFGAIAKEPNAPFPRGDLEARANMGRNTMKRQVLSAVERQADFERKNKERLEEAKRRRDEEIKKREMEREKALREMQERERKIKEERARMAEEDREARVLREDEDKRREEAEYTTDAETGEKKKREKKPREKRQKRKKKAEEDSDGEAAGGTDAEGGGKGGRSRGASTTPFTGTGSDGEAETRPRQKKKRKLERKGQAAKSSKFKSAEMVEESEDDDVPAAGGTPIADDDDVVDRDGDDAEAAAAPGQRKKAARVLDDDDDGDEEMEMENGMRLQGVEVPVGEVGDVNADSD
ncbi:protein required for normal CLN1 and CLN2 G1 cyclin expression [Recurvomyces mirabilis]|nr:protein required for normal CLN1 and CLN2 G1 cyclin expression [Recurvomyces mirabilis]